jgi:hypothetical protein
MKPSVTIDQLDLKDHVRWANDQTNFDVSLIKESDLVAHHPEISGTSAIYPSKLEELFEMQKKNLPWAAFETPKNFHMFSRRFFSYRLFPNIYWEEDSEEDKDENDPQQNLKQRVLNLQNPEDQSQSLFERDKTAILGLLESIVWINRLLKQINARKLQYQKG